jgi:hypothetical protein
VHATARAEDCLPYRYATSEHCFGVMASTKLTRARGMALSVRDKVFFEI